MGALFELRVLAPLVAAPNRLIEYQPLVGDGNRRTEALVAVAGHELYVEATIFTRQDTSYLQRSAFWFDPAEQQAQEGAALRNKILEKALQCEGAGKPVLLFVAEGMVTTGLTFGRDPRHWAMAHLLPRGGAPSVSAAVFCKDVRCLCVEMHTNPHARLPIHANAIAWIDQRCRNAWRMSGS